MINVVLVRGLDRSLDYFGFVLFPEVAKDEKPDDEAKENKGAEGAPSDVVDEFQVVTSLLIIR